MDIASVILITSLIIMAALGFASSSIAKGKNRGPIRWFFMGFFFGLLGLILVACLPASNKGMRQCGKCAEFIMMQARVCKHCGAEV